MPEVSRRDALLEGSLKETRSVQLSRGMVATVDACDYEAINQHRWYASKANRPRDNWYAFRSDGRGTVYMHRQIMGAKKGTQVDHIDGNGLNNTRANLRLCSQSQNNANNTRSVGQTGYRGVEYVSDHLRKYRAVVWKNSKRINKGDFSTAEEAARARDAAALELYGEFAKLNFPARGRP